MPPFKPLSVTHTRKRQPAARVQKRERPHVGRGPLAVLALAGVRNYDRGGHCRLRRRDDYRLAVEALAD